jgi:hypothetical protein
MIGSKLIFSLVAKQSFCISLDRTKDMSSFILGLFEKYVEETSKLQNHSNHTHEAQVKSLEEFQKAYEVIHPPFCSPLIGRIMLVYLTNTITSCRSNQSLRNKGFWRISPVWCLNTLFGKESWCVCCSMLLFGHSLSRDRSIALGKSQ